jgi:cell division protein FtsI (penicillin-binding protein 3)
MLGLGLLLIVVRLVHLTVVQRDTLAQRAAGQYRHRETVTPQRGAIVDRNGRRLAFSVGAESLYVHPAKLPTDVDDMIPVLAQHLSLPAQQVDAVLHSSKPFVWLKRGVFPQEASQIKALNVSGLDSKSTQRRVYPYRTLAAPLLGFVNVDAQGLEGIEKTYDRYLLGPVSHTLGERDGRQRAILVRGGAQPPETFRVRLTLDTTLQYVAERELERAVRHSRAAAGSVIILDPQTFAILALAQVPTFDPNTPGDFPPAARRNRVISDYYEPGSTLKALLVAAALDAKQVNETDPIFCEHGAYRVGGHTIHDVHPYGELSVDGVLTKSSNIGAAKIGERLGKERYYDYLWAFGLGQKTSVDLPGEISGALPSLRAWSRIKLVTASFGQGVAVTPLQLACAYAALANEGMLMRPYVVSEIVSSTGEVVHANGPTPIRQVIQPETAQRIRTLLEHVVAPGGTGRRAHIQGFRVAGKTGTSQKHDPRGGYSETGRIASFIGMVPAEQPRLVILAIINEPKTATYGGVVAAPVFQAIARQALAYLGVAGSAGEGTDIQWAGSPQFSTAKLSAESTFSPEAYSAAGDDSLVGRSEADDFIGLSLRAAMRKASANGLQIVAHGSGYVTDQRIRNKAQTGEAVYELRLEADE